GQRDPEPARFLYYGVLGNRWRLFGHPSLPEHELIMGYRGGDSSLDSSYFYSPYIPFSPRLVQSERLETIDTVSYRGKKLLKHGSKFFAKIIVSGLDRLK